MPPILMNGRNERLTDSLTDRFGGRQASEQRDGARGGAFASLLHRRQVLSV